jgi:hypothetical protein
MVFAALLLVIKDVTEFELLSFAVVLCELSQPFAALF